MSDFLQRELPLQQRLRGHELAGEALGFVHRGYVGGICFALVGGAVVTAQMSELPKEIMSTSTLLQILNICVGVTVVYAIKTAFDRVINLFSRVAKLELMVHDLNGKKDGRDTD